MRDIYDGFVASRYHPTKLEVQFEKAQGALRRNIVRLTLFTQRHSNVHKSISIADALESRSLCPCLSLSVSRDSAMVAES